MHFVLLMAGLAEFSLLTLGTLHVGFVPDRLHFCGKFPKKCPISPLNLLHSMLVSRLRRRQIGWSMLTLLALFCLFLMLRKGQSGAYQALPEQMAVVLEFNGVVKGLQVISQSPRPAWRQFSKTSLFRVLLPDVATTERIFRNDAALQTAFLNQRLLAAFTLNPADSLHALFVLETAADFNLSRALTIATEAKKYFPSVYHEQQVFTVYLADGKRMVLAQAGNMLIFSRFSYLVEDALAQLENGGSWWTKRKYARQLPPEAPLKIQLQPEALASRYGPQLAAPWRQLADLLTRNATWIGIALDGQQVVARTESKGFLSHLDAFGTQEPGAIYSILPEHAAFLAWVGFSHHRPFFNNITDDQTADFERYILPWAGREAAYVITEPFSPAMQDDQFIVLGVRDTALATRQLREYARQSGSLQPESSYQAFEMFRFLSQSALQPLVGDDPAFRNPVGALVGNYVVFAGNRSALELWIDKFTVNQTLAGNTDFLQWQQKMPARSQALVFLNATYLPALLKNLFDPGEQPLAAEDLAIAGQVGFWGADLQPGPGGVLALQLASQSQAGAVPSTAILWKTPLAAEAATPPFVIPGRGAASESAILIQDADNQLYCLDPGGTVRWRRSMAGRILGPVQGIDFQGNQRDCYLFNTATQLWLLDDAGQDVSGFPIQLQSPATNGVRAIDFDLSLRYYYFVACANGNLYGYDQFGRSLAGWNPQAGVGQVTQPLVHSQRGDKDYLIVLNQKSQLRVYGRDGAARFPTLPLEGTFAGPPQVDAVSKSPRIIAVNTAGKAVGCNLGGEPFSLQVGKGAKTSPAKGAFLPLTGDLRYEYAVLQGGTVTASGYEGNALRTIFSTVLPAEQDTLFEVTGQRLGTLSRSKRQVNLLDGRGQLHPDFPLAGTTPFVITDIFRQAGQQVLVVGNGKSVYAYKVR